MTHVVLRNLELDDDVHARLLEIARSHGRTVEEEVREIVRGAVMGQQQPEPQGLGSRMAAYFESIGLQEDERIQELRGGFPEPPDFDR